jgi:hypothetical protein
MKKIMGAKKINNCPDYVKGGDVLVVREADGFLWFYGDYKSDIKKAYEVAEKEGGIVMLAMEVADDVSET